MTNKLSTSGSQKDSTYTHAKGDSECSEAKRVKRSYASIYIPFKIQIEISGALLAKASAQAYAKANFRFVYQKS